MELCGEDFEHLQLLRIVKCVESYKRQKYSCIYHGVQIISCHLRSSLPHLVLKDKTIYK